MHILGIAGGIRQNSSNATLLKLTRSILSKHTWALADISALPYFDPDLQYSEGTPAVVTGLRKAAEAADLIVICTPEYAHGIPGMLKNALEWMFCELTMKKPVAVVIGAAQGQWVRKHLLDVLPTMDFLFGEDDSLIIQGARARISADGHPEPELESELREFLARMMLRLPQTGSGE
jgi:chromate reductase